MRRIRTLVVGAAVAAGLTPWRVAGAQNVLPSPDNTAYGTTAAEFLSLASSARGAALGGGYGAMVNDLSATHFNAAGLASLARPGIMGSSMSYVADTRYAWAAFGIPFGGGSKAVALSVTSFGFSDQPIYTVDDPDGESGELYSVGETAVGATYAQRFSDRFSAGLTGKYISDRLGRVSASGFAVDFGTQFHASVGGRALRAGFVIQNLGTNLKHDGQALDAAVIRTPPGGVDDVPQEPANARLQTKGWSLPVMFRVSLSYDVFETSLSRFSMMGEFTQPNNTDPGFNVAGEYNLGLGSSGFSVAGRAGYTYQPDNNLDPGAQGSPNFPGFPTAVDDDEGKDGMSFGGGIRFARRSGFNLSFDYAYRHLGLLGSTNMVTVGLSW